MDLYPNNNGTYNPTFQPEESNSDILQYFFLFLRNWYWLVLGLGLGLFLAWFNLRYATTIYQVKGTVLINEKEQQSFSEEMIMEDLGFSSKSNVENELQILKSASLMERVVDSLEINVVYIQEGRVKSSEQYQNSAIKLINFFPVEEAYGSTLRIKTKDDKTFRLVRGESDTLVLPYGIPFQEGGISYTLEKRYTPSIEAPYTIRIQAPARVARNYAGQLQLQSIGRSNVIALSMKDAIPQKAIAIINKLIELYNISVIEQKNSSGEQTLKFIDERLRFITQELYDVEKQVEGFKNKNQLPLEISTQAQQYLNKVNVSDEQLMELQLRESVIKDLSDFISSDVNRYKTLPLGSEILTGTLSELVNQYNKLIFDREQLLESAKPANPAVATFEEQLNYLRRTILQSINSMQAELASRQQQIEARMAPIERQIRSIPSNEREFLKIMREQQIKEQLFLYLFQKREETALSIVAQVANSRILDPVVGGAPVSPNQRQTYLIAIFLGLALPGGLIFLRDYFDTKVYSKQDIQKLTKAPFLGVIGKSKNEEAIVISKNSRSAVAEMFRLLRTNLQFMAAGKKGQVVLVTSSISGEGKSFITINLGISQALSNKRTILVGLDLRKPKMALYLTGKKAAFGMTNYLVGSMGIDEVIQSLPEYPNVDYIGAGPIPPNPAELLMNDRLATLMVELRQRYDFIIIDTAPLGLVTDAFLIDSHVDQSIMVTRFGKTTQNFIRMIEEVYQNKKLANVSIVLNGVKGSQGYGYGYGYYKEDKKMKREKRWQFWK